MLTDFEFTSLNPQKLTVLDLRNNDFLKRDLSCFAQFVNLTELLIGTNERRAATRTTHRFYNRFYGSLEPLKLLVNLERLDISGTDVDSGLEYLPKESLKEINCSTNGRIDAKVEKIEQLVKGFKNEHFKKKIDVGLIQSQFG